MSCAQGWDCAVDLHYFPCKWPCFLQARSFDSHPAFKEIPLDILIQICLYDLNDWSYITCTSSQDQAFDFGIGSLSIS